MVYFETISTYSYDLPTNFQPLSLILMPRSAYLPYKLQVPLTSSPILYYELLWETLWIITCRGEGLALMNCFYMDAELKRKRTG